MLMRKACALRISWSHHLYGRASLPETAGTQRQKFHHLLGETHFPKSSTSPADSNDCRPSLIVRTICRQNAPALFSITTSRGPAGVSDLSLGSSDGYFLHRRISCLLRRNSDGAQGRAFHHQASARYKHEKFCFQESGGSLSGIESVGDNGSGLGTKDREDPRADSELRKLPNFVASLKNVSSFESSPLESSKAEIRAPVSGVVNLKCNPISQGLGFPTSSALPSFAGSSSKPSRVISAPSFVNFRPYSSERILPSKIETTTEPLGHEYSQRAVVTALWCNFLVFSLKLGVWVMTSSHVMLAEAIHSLADLANQGLLAYGLMSSKRAPDAMHPYGYTKERFVWSLISAVGIFCLGSGATIIHGIQNLFSAEPLENVYLAALVLGGSAVMEGASLLVAISCVRNGAEAEGMTMRDYLWRGHDPTSVAVMMEDGAAVTGLGIAALALAAAHYTGNPMWDPIGSIVVGNLLGVVAIFLIQRNRQALLGRSMDDKDMMRVISLLSKDPVVDAIYDCKSEVIGPGAYRFKAEIDFNGIAIVQNYLKRAGHGNWHKEFTEAVSSAEPGQLERVMAAYGEEVVSALGSEVDRLEKEIQKIVPGIRHVDIEAHNPNGPAPREKLYIY
ncbi:hypothetical protein R1flu_029015 [Riccia fluitans]|uniref:Cation efflux protein transmembrane domain-containing protein n=1 Tax=Riccia fluitans TaxID=41844 RepID=A0ABD1XNB9_9MARC